MNICIIGDSWGCGEWSEWKGIEFSNQYGVTHKGIEQYIIDEGIHLVTNLSRGNSSNIRALQRLKKELQTQEFDLIFWFVTDPLRDVSTPAIFKACWHENSDFKIHAEDLIQFQEEMIEAAFGIANIIGKKIYLIGGTYKIDVTHSKKFSNLECYIPALTEWLLPEYEHPNIWRSDWFYDIERNVSTDVLDLLLTSSEKIGKLLRKYPELFFPDGTHPNRKAHRLLYEKIKKDFLDKES